MRVWQMGGSSGGIGFVRHGVVPQRSLSPRAHFTLGTSHVNQQSPTDPNLLHGAFELEEHLIPAARRSRSRFRIWMEVGDRDNGRPGDVNTHDWVAANEIMKLARWPRRAITTSLYSRGNAGHIGCRAGEEADSAGSA